MSIRISIMGEVDTHRWWKNFRDAVNNNQIDIEHSCLDDILALWNCCDVKHTEFLEFDSEKDLALFLLRWS